MEPIRRIIKIGHIAKLYLLYLIFSNTVNLVIMGKPAYDFFLYAGIFVVFFVMILILERFFNQDKIYAVIFLLSSGIAGALNTQGYSILFAIFAVIYSDADKRIIYATIFIWAVSEFIQHYFFFHSVPLIFNQIALAIVFALMYYEKIHPKPVTLANIPGLSDDDKKIISLMISGYSQKDIASKLDIHISHAAVRSRINRLRFRFECETNEQLIYQLGKLGAFDS